jgi:cytidyltransferase-like protein
MNICKIGIASGYFNPLHRGHMDYLKAAYDKSDYLIVIINNDIQVRLKNSIPYIKQEDRELIISNMYFVKDTIVSIDQDDSVSQTLKEIVLSYGKMHKYVFFNSGDRNPQKYNKKEKDMCSLYNITQCFLELPKVNSSSSIVDNLVQNYKKFQN